MFNKKNKKINNNIKNEVSNFANQPLKKKISFFSAMLIVVGSSIGAGIFFKAGEVLKNSGGSVIFAIFSWLVAAFGVICMALALVEIASARNDNLSLIGWCKTFNSKYVYKACKNFMMFINLPLTYFFMPLYVIMSFQDAAQGFGLNVNFGNKNDWIIATILALIIFIFFITTCGLSTKLGNIQNWFISSIKFLPLIFCSIIGFVILGISGFQGGINNAVGNGVDFVPKYQDSTLFARLSPGIGLFISSGAIFFAYDGFYVAAGIQTELKEPKKTPAAILVGLIVVTIIYLLIAISMSIASSEGNPVGLKEWLMIHTSINGVNWLYGLLLLTIAIGVLGVINGFALWSPKFTQDLIQENELPFSGYLKKYLNSCSKPIIGILYNVAIVVPTITILCIIGSLAYVDANDYGVIYGDKMQNLYSFADLLATWTAVFSFFFILCAIFGGIKNRYNKKINVTKTKYFLFFAYLSEIFVGLPLIFSFLQPFANLILYLIHQINNIKIEILISRILLIVLFILIICILILPTYIQNKKNKKSKNKINI